MASDESTTMVCSMQREDEYEDVDDVCYYDPDHRNPSQHSTLSRLSVCTSNDADDDDDDDGKIIYHMDTSMSRLSVEDGDEADGELSDPDKSAGKHVGGGGGERLLDLVSSESDKEPGCYSLPATPPRRRRRNYPGVGTNKAYASENEAQKCNRGNSRRNRRVKREYLSWFGGKMRNVGESDHSGSPDGGDRGGVMVITRPKGGGRALCLDLEEVKACKELGFELEPGQVSFSAGSTLDTSSGGNSPIANWRISSPGDDPRDVKSRLKMWAQTVALVSASRHGS